MYNDKLRMTQNTTNIKYKREQSYFSSGACGKYNGEQQRIFQHEIITVKQSPYFLLVFVFESTPTTIVPQQLFFLYNFSFFANSILFYRNYFLMKLEEEKLSNFSELYWVFKFYFLYIKISLDNLCQLKMYFESIK